MDNSILKSLKHLTKWFSPYHRFAVLVDMKIMSHWFSLWIVCYLCYTGLEKSYRSFYCVKNICLSVCKLWIMEFCSFFVDYILFLYFWPIKVNRCGICLCNCSTNFRILVFKTLTDYTRTCILVSGWLTDALVSWIIFIFCLFRFISYNTNNQGQSMSLYQLCNIHSI